MSSALWCDKYRPSHFDEILFHKKQAACLQNLVSNGDFPHLLFHGPSGSGRRTLIACLLMELFGPTVEKVKLEQMEFTSSSKKIEINAVSSSQHIMLTPSDAGFQDRIVVQEVIKSIAQANQMTSLNQKKFKVIVLDDVDQLTKDAQHALRRTMEKCSAICRIILICNGISRVIPALRSRALAIRVPAPSADEVKEVLNKIARDEGFEIPAKLAARIVSEADGNVKRAILILETCHVQSFPLTGDQEIAKLDWKSRIQAIATTLVQEQTPSRLMQVRDKFYDLLGHLIPAETIFKDLLDALLPLCDEKLKVKVIALAAKNQHRCCLGQKDIFHLEAFVAGFMCLYKNFVFDNLDGF